ncbi:sigma-54-dependent transcriptional regulator [Sphingomonas sp. CFBP 8760]|uniref:sigma-54-dependent transcriptional regulator n=1 Tax=Sphingomonas sp. CFBP 8760 TaxID=2775282 RepID=UPI001FCE6C13|nr:sigma-54 dependent transcriptional regulator [Sphingomonas sp. CFBP 8760]
MTATDADDMPVVALVDDDDDLRTALAQTLDLAGYRVVPFTGAEAALAAIDPAFPGVVVTDVRMPQIGGIELFRRLRECDPDLPVLLMTGHADVPMAVDALRAGAWDFLTKPFDPEALLAALARAVAQRSLVLDNRRLRALALVTDASPLVGRSVAIERLRDTIAVVAQTDIDILIEGETGTGKELVARLIHRGGRRARAPFVGVACAALPDTLLDEEMFAARGTVAAARGGTLFLDDIDRASPALQERLVPLAEDRTLRVAGGHDAMPVDLRLIATADDQAEDRVLPALFYRLAAVRLRIPPLRERLDDVPLLFAHLVDTAAARLRRPIPPLTHAVRQHLATHRWPGNVRELAHFADRVVIGLEGVEADHLAAAATLPERVDGFERQAIIDAVTAAGGEIGVAIQQLGLPRKTFYYKVQRLGIDLTTLRRSIAPPRP